MVLNKFLDFRSVNNRHLTALSLETIKMLQHLGFLFDISKKTITNKS